MVSQEEALTTTAAGPGFLSPQSADNISERLSKLDNLYFPRAKQSSAASPSLRKPLLLDLISRDVAVFLERYGSQLTLEELKEFDVLKDDYEVNWHLNHLRSLLSPTKEELKLKSVTIKNRRRAYLDKLVDEGQYFSEDAMREREPYLHHEYLGKFQDPSGRSMPRPGERWSDTLMRRAEDAMLMEKIRGEQQRQGLAQSDWVGNDNQIEQMEEMETEEESESEEEEVESEDEATGSNVANGASHNQEVPSSDAPSSSVVAQTTRTKSTEEVRPSAEEMQDRLEQFTVFMQQKFLFGEDQPSSDAPSSSVAQTTTTKSIDEASLPAEEEMHDRLDQFTVIMQQKFLSGEDEQHFDYSKIDEDERLDDHWTKEANYDAEEKYFDDD